MDPVAFWAKLVLAGLMIVFGIVWAIKAALYPWSNDIPWDASAIMSLIASIAVALGGVLLIIF